MKIEPIKKLLSIFLTLALVFNTFLNYFFVTTVYAQQEPSSTEAVATASTDSPAPEPSVTPTPALTSIPEIVPTMSPAPTSEPSATPSATSSLAPSSTPVPTPGPTLAPSIWQNLDNSSVETINNVETGKDYAAPQNDKVRVLFTKLPDPSGKLTIKEVKLTSDQINATHALSDTAYEITSTMTDGTFEYDLTLPLPETSKGKKIEVKSAETTDGLNNAQTVNEPKEEKVDTITIKGLNHFTVFILTTPSPDTAQRVLINEILPNPVAGAEWIELYNNGTQAVNLAAGMGWTIRNFAGDTQSLGALGTIPPAGRVVFNAPLNWLSNTAPENITLSNELGTTIDTITVSLVAPGFAIDHYPLIGESVGRKTDGVSEWVIFTSPTKGTANIVPVNPGGGLTEVGPIAPDGGLIAGFPVWYKDSNGLAIDLMEAADSFGISDPVDPDNAFSAQIGFNAEGFWWSAEASIDRSIGTRTILVLALEAAFAGEAAVDGEQSVQNRVRYRIDGLVPGETYTITHPFGSVQEVAEDDGVINVTDDIGCFAGGGATCNQTTTPNFSSALNGQVGPYLTWTTFNTNPNLTDPQLINPANPGRRYVGNPLVEHTVTGSPTGNNFFRVQGPNVGGPGVNQIETNLFSVSGRLADANAPVITLFGANPVNVNQNATYTDAGATALDDLGGNLTGSIVVTGLPVDTTTLGAQTVTYTVTDGAGRISVATRTVNVVAVGDIDATAPVITVLGANPATVTQGTPFSDTGATALDNVDGDITANIATTGLPVNTSAPGTFTVTYNVSDAAGNADSAARTVNVVADTITPVITVIGSNPVNILTGAPYTDAGATATDNVGGNMTANIVTTGLPINTAITQANTVTYTVTDAAGNTTTATRTVNVAGTLSAGLVEVGPIAPAGGLIAGFPTWYKDSNGLAIDLMEAADSFGISDPVDPDNAFSAQIGFNAEGFWWSAEASPADTINTVTGVPVSGILVLALEAAFAGEAAVDGEQSVQNRVRYRIDGLVPGETYTITHPFGSVQEVAEDDGVINVTDDIGCFAGGGATCNQTTTPNFSSALNGQVGPFLTWTTFNTNPALTDPQLINPANPGRRYVGNPSIEHAVTGSPIGNNSFSVTGPGLSNFTTNLFSVSGRLADVTAPVITIIGANPVSIEQGAVYTYAGVTATDNIDGIVTVVTTGLPLDTSAAGVKTITYTATDRAGNTATATRTVNVGTISPVLDATAPVITILGSGPVDVTVGAVYTDSGATALDDTDGDITANIVVTGLPIDTSLAGTFTVTYNVSDAAGNAATPVARTVNVVAAPIQTGAISGTSFHDVNANRLKDAGELTLSGWTIFLDTNDNGLLDLGEVSTVTGLLGSYSFSDLAPGTYNVREVVQDTWALTTPRSGNGKHVVTVAAGDNIAGKDFGETVFQSVSGQGKFVSTNGTNSTPQVISLGTSVISVTTAEGTNSVTIPDATEITRSDGGNLDVTALTASEPSSTSLTGMDTGVVVKGKLQWGIPNLGLLFSNPITLNIFIGTNLNGQTLNVLRSVTGTSDWTNDGIADPKKCTVTAGMCTFQATKASFYIAADTATEAAATGTVTIVKDTVPDDIQDFNFRIKNDAFDENFSLDDDGNNANELSNTKTFSNLTAGSYSLSENSASNWVLGISCQDPDNGTTLDADARAATVDLDSGENITCTFTNSLRRSITGMKFNDLNGDGDKDAGEPGLPGWTVFLDTNDNGILDNGETTSVTNTNGNYEFTNLGGGTYNVREVLQNGWVQTTPVSGKYTLTITSNASLTNQDFGNFKKVSITGSLWKDLNANKIWDALEPGLGGWSVTLGRVTPALTPFVPGGPLSTEIVTPVSTITTAAGTGSFSFTVGKIGQYRITENPLAGWQQTSPTDSFFDVSVNESGQVTITRDKNGKDLMFGNTPFYTVSPQARFASASGVNGQTSSVISLGASTLNAEGNGGISIVTIPDGTVITRIDGLDFDSSQLTTSIPALNSILGLRTGVTAGGVLQWGIPNLGLQFSNPITLNIYVGTTLNGQTLNVMRSTTGTSGWTDDGIVAPKTCTVANGLCSFQATKASYYVAAKTVAESSGGTGTTTSSSNTTSSTTSSSSSSTGSSNASVCTDTKPGSAPVLLSWKAENPNEVMLTWSKAQDPVTYYLVAYGTKPGSVEFGNPNIGNTTSYTIKGLSGGTTYYVKVRAGNGCTPGDFSQELAVTPFGDSLSGTAEGFEQNVLGATTEDSKQDILGTIGQTVKDKKPQSNIFGNNLYNMGFVIGILVFIITIAYTIRKKVIS